MQLAALALPKAAATMTKDTKAAKAINKPVNTNGKMPETPAATAQPAEAMPSAQAAPPSGNMAPALAPDPNQTMAAAEALPSRPECMMILDDDIPFGTSIFGEGPPIDILIESMIAGYDASV